MCFEMPKCPYCGYEFTDEDIWDKGDFPTEYSGDESEFNCYACGESLRVVVDMTPQWEFIDEDGEAIPPTPNPRSTG